MLLNIRFYSCINTHNVLQILKQVHENYSKIYEHGL